MPKVEQVVIGGVDTHKDVHVAAVIDERGRLLGTSSFASGGQGPKELLAWMASLGRLSKVDVEGTGAYGAGLLRYLAEHGIEVIEVIRPNRQARRRRGKSDTADAEAAARAVLSGEASVVPKTQGRDRRVDPGPASRLHLGPAIPLSGGAADPGPDCHRTRGAALGAGTLSASARVARCARFRPGGTRAIRWLRPGSRCAPWRGATWPSVRRWPSSVRHSTTSPPGPTRHCEAPGVWVWMSPPSCWSQPATTLSA